jgi:hypothetical protein
LKNKIASNALSDFEMVREVDQLPAACWRLLGSLNSGRVDSVAVAATRGYLEAACGLPLSEGYPIFAWVTENTVRRFEHSDQAGTQIRHAFEGIVGAADLGSLLAARTSRDARRTEILETVMGRSSALVVRAGQREQGLEFLRQWCGEHVREYVKICDPYFCKEDLGILRLLSDLPGDLLVSILTSRKAQEGLAQGEVLEEAYRTYWRVHVAEQAPPSTEVMVVGAGPSGFLPVHDRWIITRNGGLNIGTSFNSLGVTKDSAITVLGADEAAGCEEVLDGFLSRRERQFRGERLSYSLFTL